MRKKYVGLVAAVAAASIALTACSSSKSSGGSAGAANNSSAPSGSTIKVGLLNDSTGPASSAFLSTTKGVDAALNPINAAGGINGHKIQYVLGDTTSTPAGALTAAEKLVQQDHVFAIIENSSVFYGAEPWLKQHGIPVIGSAIDGPIWADAKNTNLFAAGGPTWPGYSNTYFGQYVKSVGGTKCGALGYAESVSAQQSATGFVQSCEKAGLKAGYINNQVPTGNTDVGAIALAIKNSGTDSVYLPIDPSTGFAVAAALSQMGVHLKTLLFATGYGGDLLSNKAGVQAAQGLDFSSITVPVEANTPATQAMAKNLAAVGVNTSPSFSEMEGYLLVGLLQAGLQAAGSSPSAASLSTALSGISNYDDNGLIPTKYSPKYTAPVVGTSQSCAWILKLQGTAFKVQPGMPACGTEFKVS